MKRPLYLTILLVLMAWGCINGIYEFTFQTVDFSTENIIFPQIGYTVVALIHLVNLIGVVLIWKWKKLGFQLICLSSLVLCLFLILAVELLLGIVAVVIFSIFLGIFYLLLKPIWKDLR